MTDETHRPDRPDRPDIGDAPTVSPSAVPTAGLGGGAAPPLPDRIGGYLLNYGDTDRSMIRREVQKSLDPFSACMNHLP